MQLVDINIGLHGFKVGEMIQLGQKLKIQQTGFLLNADWIQNLIKAEQSRGRPELSQ